MCQSWDYVYGLMTLVCLPGFNSMIALSLDLFYYQSSRYNIDFIDGNIFFANELSLYNTCVW